MDFDPASNAFNWQWIAGSGADASPYFRVFNPVTQSEKFDPDQLQLVLEDIEIAIAEAQEHEEDRARRSGRPVAGQRTGRAARAFPAHLPRVVQVVEPASLACPCGCGQMVRIGEDRSSRLDVTPAQYRVIETVRPRRSAVRSLSPWQARQFSARIGRMSRV